MNELVAKNVAFCNSELLAVKERKTGRIYAGINSVLRELGFSDKQIEYRRDKWKDDKVPSKGILKFSGTLIGAGTGKDTWCIEVMKLPLALAKIEITQKMKREMPDLTDKLEKYQENCADVLADAFLENTQTPPPTLQQQIQTIAKGTEELYQRVDEVTEDVKMVKQEIESLKLDLPILPIEADKITEAVRKKGVAVLGGKQSNAYNDRGLRQKLYNNLYSNLKYNFGVKSYKSIKRSQCDKAIEIIQKCEPPFFLTVMIDNENSQHTMTWKEMLGDE